MPLELVEDASELPNLQIFVCRSSSMICSMVILLLIIIQRCSRARSSNSAMIRPRPHSARTISLQRSFLGEVQAIEEAALRVQRVESLMMEWGSTSSTPRTFIPTSMRRASQTQSLINWPTLRIGAGMWAKTRESHREDIRSDRLRNLFELRYKSWNMKQRSGSFKWCGPS